MARMRVNGLGYPLVGGTRPRHIAGINSKPGEVPENAQTPNTTPALHQTQCGASVSPTFFVGDRVQPVVCVPSSEVVQLA